MEPIILLFFLWFFYLQRRAPQTFTLYREPYNANIIFSLENIIQKPGLFFKLTRFHSDVWLDCLYGPLEGSVTYPRNYQNYSDMTHTVLFFERRRRCQIPIAERLFRWNVIMVGMSFSTLVFLSDQHSSTVCRDFHHINVLVLHQTEIVVPSFA